jgi:hypothetical protein
MTMNGPGGAVLCERGSVSFRLTRQAVEYHEARLVVSSSR